MLSTQDLEIATIAALTELGTSPRLLQAHIQAALATGMAHDDVAELMILLTLYSGYPSAINGMVALQEVAPYSAPQKKTETVSGHPYKNTPVQRVDSRIVHEFNRGTFLESMAIGTDDAIYTTSLFEGTVYRQKDGEVKKLTAIDGILAGLTWTDDQHLLVTGNSKLDGPVVLRIEVTTGATDIIAQLPDAQLLNGIAKMSPHEFMIADSFKGVIWKLNAQTGETSVWLDHALLRTAAPEQQKPGVNGIKIHQQAIYISNTNQRTIVKIPLNTDGTSGRPEVVHENVFIDDFEIAADGTIYGATHIYDNVIQITPEGEVSIFPQADQGVAGSTCLAWKDAATLLVSTDGGMISTPDACNIVPVKIVELTIH